MEKEYLAAVVNIYDVERTVNETLEMWGTKRYIKGWVSGIETMCNTLGYYFSATMQPVSETEIRESGFNESVCMEML